MPILFSVPSPQVLTDASLRCLDIVVVAVVQNHLLDVTEEGFDRVFITGSLG